MLRSWHAWVGTDFSYDNAHHLQFTHFYIAFLTLHGNTLLVWFAMGPPLSYIRPHGHTPTKTRQFYVANMPLLLVNTKKKITGRYVPLQLHTIGCPSAPQQPYT
jgi:hypothetical protein